MIIEIFGKTEWPKILSPISIIIDSLGMTI